MYLDNYKELEKAIIEGESVLKNGKVAKKFVEYFAKDFDDYNKRIKVHFVFEKDSIVLMNKKSGYRIPINVLSKTKGSNKYLCLKQMQEFTIFVLELTEKFKKKNNIS